jgi:hypothetical protein
MPLVRIFTRLSEYPTELVRRLRSRGFDVETCVSRSPDQVSADLEISLEQCSIDGVPDTITCDSSPKDVYILANANAGERKIRSIGMVLLSEGEGTESVQKTAVPAQVLEIYTALLRQRQAGEQSREAAYGNWKEWRRVRRVAETLGQKTLSVAQELSICCDKKFELFGAKLGQALVHTMHYLRQVPAIFTGWYESRIFGKQGRELELEIKGNHFQLDPELIPSIFNLSDDQAEAVGRSETDQKVIHVVTSRPPKTSKLNMWKGFAFGSVGLLAIALLTQGFSRTPASAKDKSDSVAPVTAVAEPQKAIVKVGPEVVREQTTLKRVRKLSAEDIYFDQVVVRRLTPSTAGALPAKAGIKKRVVVD